MGESMYKRDVAIKNLYDLEKKSKATRTGKATVLRELAKQNEKKELEKNNYEDRKNQLSAALPLQLEKLKKVYDKRVDKEDKDLKSLDDNLASNLLQQFGPRDHSLEKIKKEEMEKLNRWRMLHLKIKDFIINREKRSKHKAYLLERILGVRALHILKEKAKQSVYEDQNSLQFFLAQSGKVKNLIKEKEKSLAMIEVNRFKVKHSLDKYLYEVSMPKEKLFIELIDENINKLKSTRRYVRYYFFDDLNDLNHKELRYFSKEDFLIKNPFKWQD